MKPSRALIETERFFLHEEGIPGRPWFKHVMYAPKFTYAPEMLPGVAEAVAESEVKRAREQLERITVAIERAAIALEKARGEEEE